MICACGHAAEVHEGRCYAPHCQCERFREPPAPDQAELAWGIAMAEAEAVATKLPDLFPAPKGKDEPTLPLAVVYPSRSGRPWAHVVTVVDDPARPHLTCGCRGFAIRGACWATARVAALLGIEPGEERR